MSTQSIPIRIIDKDDFDSDECLKMCMSHNNAKGCQWKDNGKCSIFFEDVTSSNGANGYQCYVFKESEGM